MLFQNTIVLMLAKDCLSWNLAAKIVINVKGKLLYMQENSSPEGTRHSSELKKKFEGTRQKLKHQILKEDSSGLPVDGIAKLLQLQVLVVMPKKLQLSFWLTQVMH